MRARIALLALLLLPTIPLAAQTIPPPLADEAPEALLGLTVSDAEVSLFAAGTGTTGIATGIGWVVSRDPSGSVSITAARPFPGLESIPFFFRPDFTISLWLLQRYFFETTISGELSAGTFLFGYSGREGESVQLVLIGNTAIGMGAYPYLGFGDATGTVGQDAPGASALFATPTSTHELMIRFAPAEEQTLVYADGGIVTETTVGAAAYERNTHFVLPDGGLDFLDVYAESATGAVTGSDGRRYRRVDLAREASFSLADGTISFPDAPEQRVLVYYEVSGAPIGDPTLGRDALFALDLAGRPDELEARDFEFVADGGGTAVGGGYIDALFGSGAAATDVPAADFVVRLEGRDALLLHEPGRYAPFSSAAYYPFADRGATSVTIDAGRDGGDPALAVVPIPGRGVVRIAGGGPDPRSYANRYPFARTGATAGTARFADLYGPAAGTAAGPAVREPEIVFRRIEPTEQIVLPSGFIPGSVRVTRNGIAENGFVVSDSGDLVFDRPLSGTDVVRIAFRTSGSAEAGDFLFGSGNAFSLGPGMSAQLALGARWKPVGRSYSTAPGEYPGRLTLSGSAAIDSSDRPRPTPGELRAQIDGAIALASPDTSGLLRLAGMDGEGRTIPIAPDGLFASSPPVADPDGDSAVDPVDPATLTAQTRGTLRYADYYETNALGDRALLPYPVAQPDSYETGRAGPYVANSLDAQYTGTVAVVDYEIDAAAGQNWVAGIVRVDGGSGSDFSDARRLTIPYRVVDRSGDARVFVQIGAIGEDLDADGTIDEGVGALPFGDQLTGTIAPAGTTYTEDADANGVLDGELPDLVLSRELTSLAVPPADDEAPWVTAEIAITATQARRLAETRAIRFLVSSDGADASGRIVFGSVKTDGSGFAVSYPRTGTDAPVVSVGERDEPADGSAAFASVFPEVAARLHANERVGSVLAVAWDGLGADAITLARATSVPVSDYGELRVYYRLPAGAPPGVSLTVRAVAGDTTAAETSVVADSAEWQELVLLLPGSSTAIMDSVEIDVSGPDSGSLLLDEISLWAPRNTLELVAGLNARWRPEFDLSVGARRLVSGVVLEQRLAARSTGDLETGTARSGLESSSDLAATVLGAATSFGVDLTANPAGTGLQVRHRITVPVSPAITLRDEYRVGYRSLEPGSTHAVATTLTAGGGSAIAFAWRSDQRDVGRVAWSADAGLRSGSRPTDAAPDGVPVLRVTADVDLDEERPARPVDSSYPVSWLHSFRDVVPFASPEIRTGAIGLAAGLSLGRLAVDFGGSAGFGANRATDRRTALASLEISAPLRIGEGLDVTLALGRDYELTTRGAPGAAPADDLAHTVNLYARYPLIVAFVPIAELASRTYAERSADLTDGALASIYRPEASVELRRRIGSSPWSLVLPTAVSAALARPAERDLDATRTRYEIDADALFVAPNLFGRLGSVPLVRFYDTDEFQSRVGLASEGGDGSAWETRVSVDQRARLIRTSGASVTVESLLSARLDGERDTRLTGSLTLERPDGRFPLPPRIDDWVSSRTRTTTLELDYSARSTSAVYGRLRHELVLGAGDGGSVRLHGGLGVGTERVGERRFTLAGVRIGIEGELRR